MACSPLSGNLYAVEVFLKTDEELADRAHLTQDLLGVVWCLVLQGDEVRQLRSIEHTDAFLDVVGEYKSQEIVLRVFVQRKDLVLM